MGANPKKVPKGLQALPLGQEPPIEGVAWRHGPLGAPNVSFGLFSIALPAWVERWSGKSRGGVVVATACRLILTVPVALVSGVSRAANRGVIVKGGAVLEWLARPKCSCSTRPDR